MRRWFQVLFVTGVFAAGFTLVSSRGSADCEIPRNCPCGLELADPLSFFPTLLVRGTVTSVDTSTIVMTAEEIFPNPNLHYDLNIGERFGGAIDNSLPCDGTPTRFAVGDEVLAFYARGNVDEYPNCPEYNTCIQTKCSDTDAADWDRCSGECNVETDEACVARRDEALVTGKVAAVPWADEITLRETTDGTGTIAAEDVADYAVNCRDYFPDPPLGECNDVINTVVCSVTAPSRADRTSFFDLLILLFKSVR